MNVETFERKAFPVDAVRVTADNLEEVAAWCDGTLQSEIQDGKEGEQHYVKVRVHNPLTERQTKAFVGDWVLYAGKGYKVYTNKAFQKNFDKRQEVKRQPLPSGLTGRVVVGEHGEIPQNVFSQGSAVAMGDSVGTVNPGGTTSV